MALRSLLRIYSILVTLLMIAVDDNILGSCISRASAPSLSLVSDRAAYLVAVEHRVCVPIDAGTVR